MNILELELKAQFALYMEKDGRGKKSVVIGL